MIEQKTNEVGVEIFTPEEVDAYISKLSAIIRKKFDEDVCAKLVRFEENPRQMELPLDQTGLGPIVPPGVITQRLRQHMDAHVKALDLPTTIIKDSTS